MKRIGQVATALLVAGLAIAATPPVAEAFLPEAISETARQIDGIFYLILAITGFIFILTQGLLVYAVLRWRRRSPEERAETFSENVPLELFWTAVPTVIVIGLALVSYQVLADVWEHPEDALEIEVRASQWSWEFRYSEFDVTSVDELVLPVDEPVRLLMTSNDVIHSLWVPQLRVKQDVEPGRWTEMSFTADTTGTFRMPCTEYCGLGHSQMIGQLQVLGDEDYRAWLEEMGQFVDARPDDADVYETVYLSEVPGETPAGWTLEPHVLEVPAGARVAIEVINGPATLAVHNLMIGGPYDIKSRDLPAGDSTWMTFVAGEAGEFDMWCDVPGHRQLGMFGTLVVVD